ncbi:MAG: hypothetical protein WBV31_15065 [Terriglobales bacterium]
MSEETKHGIECAEFEALLSGAIEDSDGGQLSAARRENFDAHRRVCGICGLLFAEAQAGRQWLRSLEPVEPPVHLVHNILVATSGVVSRRPLTVRADGSTTPFRERVRERWDAFFAPLTAFVRQPRFVMSFGMIFFSFSLALNVAGVKPADVAKVNLRPAALRHAYNDAQIKVVKYYDNIRFVYQIESKLRELKRANTPAEPSPEQQKENRKDNTSGQPEQRQDRNYSQEYNQPVLAGLREASPAVTATTNRRFV